MGEVGTHSMIVNKTAEGHSGDDCPSKSEVLALSSLLTVTGIYGAIECPKLEDVNKIRWDYVFTITPGSLDFPREGGTKTVTITSYKEKYVNGVLIETAQVGYDRVNQASFITGTDHNITVSSNPGDSRGSYAEFIQAESNNVHDVVCSQSGIEYETKYTFDCPSTDLYFAATGGSVSPSIISYVEEYADGVVISQTPVGYSVQSMDFVVAYTHLIIVPENTYNYARQSTITFTQDLTGNAIHITCHQAAGTNEIRYTFYVSPSRLDFTANDSRQQAIAVVSTSQQYINGIPIGTPSNIPFTTSHGSWLGGTETYVTMEPNTGAARNSAVTFTQFNTANTTVCNCYQEQGIVYGWNYYLEVAPTSIVGSAAADNYKITIDSYRKQTINGVETDVTEGIIYTNTMSSWVHIDIAPDIVSLDENTSTSSRNGVITFTQSNSGIVRTIDVTQNGMVIVEGYNYYITVDPYDLFIGPKADTHSVVVDSYKIKTLNGVETGGHITVPWTSNEPSWIGTPNGTTMYISENRTLASRNAFITFTQAESDKSEIIGVHQTEGVETWAYTLYSYPTVLFAADGESQALTITSYRDQYINDVSTGVFEIVPVTMPSTVPWISFPTPIVYTEKSYTTDLTAAANPGTARASQLTITQSISNKEAITAVSQDESDPYEFSSEYDLVTWEPEDLDMKKYNAITSTYRGVFTPYTRIDSPSDFYDNYTVEGESVIQPRQEWTTTDINGTYSFTQPASGKTLSFDVIQKADLPVTWVSIKVSAGLITVFRSSIMGISKLSVTLDITSNGAHYTKILTIPLLESESYGEPVLPNMERISIVNIDPARDSSYRYLADTDWVQKVTYKYRLETETVYHSLDSGLATEANAVISYRDTVNASGTVIASEVEPFTVRVVKGNFFVVDKDISNTKVIVSAERNTLTSPRSGSYVIEQTRGNLTKTVMVVQNGK